MFSKEHRLDRTAFAHAYTRGKRVHTAGLTIVWYAALGHKAAVVVGKKAAESAVTRNLLNRQLYAILREAKIQNGHVIVITKRALRGYSYRELQEEVMAGLARAVGRMAVSR